MRVVSVNDPAIDTESMTAAEMWKYIAERDFNLISKHFRAGQQPTIFHIDEVSRVLWEDYVDASPNDAVRRKRCFLAGVRSVENLYQRDGRFIASWEPPTNSDGVMKPEALERFSPAEVAEIGEVIRLHSFLAPRMRRSYALPDTCLEALTTSGRMYRRADANQSSPESSSVEASSQSAGSPETTAQTEPTSSGSDVRSASPTDATATATP